MFEIKLGLQARLPVRLFDPSTNAPKAGVLYDAVTCTLEKYDGSFETITLSELSWTEITSGAFDKKGKYTITVPAASIDIPGPMVYAISVTGTDGYIGAVKIVDNEEKDTYDSVAQIPTSPLLTTDARLDNLDATVSSRMAGSSYTEPDNTSIAAIKAKTDNLPADPARESVVMTRMAASSYVAPDNVSIADIKARTDLIPDDPATESTVLTRSTQYAVSRIPINPLLASDPRVDNLDTTVSSRMAAADYVAPDNAGIAAVPTLAEIEASTVLAKETTSAAIKAKTDNLPADPASESAVVASIEAAAGQLQGVGAGTLSISLVDEDSAPIPGATCFLKDKTLGVFTAVGTSDVDGHLSFAHQGGTFQLLTFKTGVAFGLSEFVLGPAEAGAKTVVGTVIVITPATAPQMCALYATLRNTDGLPAADVSGTVTPSLLPQSVNGTFYRGQQLTSVSDQSGVIVWTIPRESRVTVQIDGFCPRPYSIQIPDTAMVDLATLVKGGFLHR